MLVEKPSLSMPFRQDGTPGHGFGAPLAEFLRVVVGNAPQCDFGIFEGAVQRCGGQPHNMLARVWILAQAKRY